MCASRAKKGIAMNAAQDMLDFGDRALGAVIDAMPMIRFDAEKRFQMYAVSLHASIVQLCGGVLVLARTEHTAGIPILLRSMYEAEIDLDLLVTDAEYFQRMDAANLAQMLRLLHQSPTNPLLAGLEQRHDIRGLKDQLQAELDGLHAQKRGAMDLRARCTKAGRENEYLSIYQSLCMDAHNNVTALIERHLDARESAALAINAFGDGDPLVLA